MKYHPTFSSRTCNELSVQVDDVDQTSSEPYTHDSKRSMKTEDEWLTSDEAAEFLRVSVKTLLNMVSSGKIPYYKLSNRNRYLKSELQELLLSNKRGFYGN